MRAERGGAELLRGALARLAAGSDADPAALEAAVALVAQTLDGEDGDRLWALTDAVARARLHERLASLLEQNGELSDANREHLRDIERYAAATHCRHRALLEYFGEDWRGGACDACDWCLGELERVLLMIARRVHAETKSENLCVAGGTMLNVTACARLLEETPFKRIFIQPAAKNLPSARVARRSR